MKSEKKKKVNKKPPKKIEEKGVENASAPPFDFGGMPDRDLKKNLGCG